jgi:hypothetical protein
MATCYSEGTISNPAKSRFTKIVFTLVVAIVLTGLLFGCSTKEYQFSYGPGTTAQVDPAK